MNMHQLTDIFCQIDDFCNTLDSHTQDYMRSGSLSSSNSIVSSAKGISSRAEERGADIFAYSYFTQWVIDFKNKKRLITLSR